MNLKTYLIILHNDKRGRWQFRFQGELSPFKRFIIRKVIGWTVEESK